MQGPSRATSLLAWLLVIQILLPANPATAASTDASTLPNGRGVAPSGSAANGAAPATDLFTGAAAHEIAIEVPPGTGGMTPQLALRYASQARGDSWVGSGWSLGFPAITRSLDYGTPSYDDASDVFELAGEELVPENPSPALPRRYRTLHESFARIVHETNGSWTVTRKDGVAMRFGVTAQARITNAAGQVFQWLFEEQEDRHGNAFAASYDRRDPGTAYLATVRYTLRRTTSGALQSLDNAPAKDRRIEFVLAPRNDVAESRRAGFPSRIAHRLAGIEVKVGATLIRRYVLRYIQSADTFRSLLESVELYGSDAASRSHAAPFVTSFAYHSNVAAGTTGWQLANWYWPAGRSLVDASRQDKGVRLADVDGDARPDLVKALATLSNADPKLATFTLSADSGVFLNTGNGFATVPSPAHPLPTFAGQNGAIPFSLAWQHGSASQTTGFDIVDVSGDGRADLVGGVRDLDAASGVRSLRGMPTWYQGTHNGFVAAADVGDVLQDELWGLNRSGIVDFFLGTPTWGTNSGNARFADLDGDGLPELIVRGGEYRWTASGGPPPFVGSNPVCIDERITNYYFQNEGELRFVRAPIDDSAGVNCLASQKRVARDFQHCDIDDRAGCAVGIVYNDARAIHFADPFLGTFPWYWIWNWEFGAVDIDLNADGLADTVTATWDPGHLGLGAVSRAWLNDGTRGYVEAPAWRLPSGLYLYELGPDHSSETGLRFADVNGDGRVDLVGAQVGYQSATWLNDGDVEEATPTPWVQSAAWVVPNGLAFADAAGLDTGLRLIDIDADGMTDLVRSANGNDEVYLNRGSIPDLLTRVTNPAGARIEYGYEVSTRFDTAGADGFPDLPFVVPVVSSVTTHSAPGLADDVSGTTVYEYAGGAYDSVARAFRGFANVTEIRPDGRRTRRVYHQSEALAGQLASETISDADERVWRSSEYTYANDTTPPYAALLARVDRRDHDGAATPRIARTSYLYDAYGNPTAVTEWGEVSATGVDLVPADTRTREFSYFANTVLHLVDRVKTSILRSGATPGVGAILRESRFAYDGDESGNMVPVIGDLTRRIDVLADATRPDPTTSFGYDGYGNLTRVTDPRANAGEGGGTTRTEYDATYHAFPTAVVNALGHRSEISYETAPGCAVAQSSGAGLAGRTRSPNDLVAGTSSERCYDVFGRLVRESGPANLSTTTWTYVDTPLAVAVTESHAASASGTRATTTRYDGLGRAVEVTRTGPGGQTVFDGTVHYDAMGRIVAETQPAFGAPGPATFYTYDPLDRVESATLPGTGGRVHRRRHDRGLVEKTDPRGEIVRVRHDALGRIVRVEEVAGSETWITSYEHDASDQLTRITDHHGNTTRVDYDRVGRRIRIADPDIGHRVLDYDANGNVVSEQASGYETIFWTYDKIGRPLKKRGISPRGWKKSKITWRYDTAPNGIGLLESRSDDDIQVQRVLQYDLLGRPTREESTLVLANQRRAFEFENAYDPLGQLVTRTHPTGTALHFVRDARGYLTSITSGTSTPDAAAITWTAEGRVATWHAPGNVVNTTNYDAQTRRFSGVEVDGPGPGLLADRVYTYDVADRITGVFDGAGDGTVVLGYDARGRLTQTTRFENGAWRIRTNSYDAIGNLLCRDATGAQCSGGTQLAYPFAPGDSLRRATSHRAVSVDGAASIYDPTGVVLLQGQRRFDYDVFGNLIEAWDGSRQSMRASYDGNGRTREIWSAATGERVFLPTEDFEWTETSKQARIHVSLGGARIATHAMPFEPPVVPPGKCTGSGLGAYRGDPLDELFALFAPGLAALFLLGVGRGIRRVPAPRRARALVAAGTGTAFLLVALVPVPFADRGDARAQAGAPMSVFYHGDHLGSVLVATDANGARVGSATNFDPWGRSLSTTPLATPFGFHGKRLVESIYDYGARWYDPQMGRFLQPDPVIADPYDPQGLGRYAYVRNDPVGRIDPTGMWSVDINAWGGYIDNYGFTGITVGASLNGGGLASVGARVTIRNAPFADYARVQQSMNEFAELLRVGVFQYFNRSGNVAAQAGDGSRSGVLGAVGNVAGAIWNLPNTAIGLAYGGIGHLLGLLAGTDPSARFADGQLQFINNPLTATAMTLGQVGIYGQLGAYQPETPGRSGERLGFEEYQHTRQGNVLGPLYLPAHLVFGAAAASIDSARGVRGFLEAWHGQANLLERGPHTVPARPWWWR